MSERKREWMKEPNHFVKHVSALSETAQLFKHTTKNLAIPGSNVSRWGATQFICRLVPAHTPKHTYYPKQTPHSFDTYEGVVALRICNLPCSWWWGASDLLPSALTCTPSVWIFKCLHHIKMPVILLFCSLISLNMKNLLPEYK